MGAFRVILIFGFALFLSPLLKADPENFMVGPLTFARPDGWTWKELPQKSHASALMVITDQKSGEEAQVLISHTPSNRDDVASKWKSYFVEPPPLVESINSKRVEKFAVTFVNVEGTYRVKKVLKPDYVLVGMIIETKKGNVCGRLIGSKAMVGRLRGQFKKMIEDALKEE